MSPETIPVLFMVVFAYYLGRIRGMKHERKRQQDTIEWLSNVHAHALQSVTALVKQNNLLKNEIEALSNHTHCLLSKEDVEACRES